ncbi:hypothetical protein IW262DRAFT_1258180 [Armillaria fumosa]|nr:hypothetical protein IW262DRAFT_1258180 [Armillaria fumosa]
MKLKEIHRTSTFTWSPSSPLPLIATGTVAGALDESFSNESELEIWAPNFLDKNEFDLGIQGQSGPKGAMKDTARFSCLTWGYLDSSRPQGVIAAGMENGELALWDPAKILAGASCVASLWPFISLAQRVVQLQRVPHPTEYQPHWTGQSLGL